MDSMYIIRYIVSQNVHTHTHAGARSRTNTNRRPNGRLTDRVVPDNGFLFKDQKGHQ